MVRLINSIFQILYSLFEAGAGALADITVSASPSRRKETYNADFLDTGKVLSKSEYGYCLTGNRCLSITDSYSNAIVFGGSGSGKSSCVLIPSVLNMAGHSSLILHDPSGELFLKTGAAIKQMGYCVKVLNYTKANFSEGYNPLHRVKTISDIKKIAKLLVHTTLGSGGKDPFWNTSAENLLTIFIRYIVFYTEKKCHTLYNVLCLINAFSATPPKVDRLMVKTKDNSLLSEYKTWVAYDSKMLMSIVATARAALSIFTDPEIAKITSSDTINFEGFRKDKTILYINNDVNQMKYFSVLSSLLFEQFFASVMSHLPEKEELPVFFLLDEASSLFLGILPVAISNIRKYRAGILQIYQSQSQLFDLYGIPQGRNMLANSYARVYLPGQPLETARELELTLGKYEFLDDQNIKRTRPLLTMDEIRIIKEAIILTGNHLPIKTRLVPYYEQSRLRKLTSLPVLKPYERDSDRDIYQINIDGIEKEQPI